MNLISLALCGAAGLSRAVTDATAHGSERLIALGPWWNNATSWTRKYRDYYGGDKRPRFWGATTVLVAFSDAWHCFNALTWACADAALLVAGWPLYRWVAVGAIVLRRCVFQPLYSALRR